MIYVCVVTPSDDEDKQEKALSQLYDAMPDGRSPLDVLKDKEERRKIGESLLHADLLGYRKCKCNTKGILHVYTLN